MSDPSIRVFITVTDPDKGLNVRPPKTEWLVGPGNWPHMGSDNFEETKVSTAAGEVPGYILRGGGTTRGIRYKATGLEVYGTGHSVELVCSSAEEEWSKWESVCEHVVRSFVAGDLNAPRQTGGSQVGSLDDLAYLLKLVSPARPANTFPLPRSGHVIPWVISSGQVLWSERDETSRHTLSVLSAETGAVIWQRQYEALRATATTAGTNGIAVYSPESGLELISPTGQYRFENPSVGPGYISAGDGDRLYIVEHRTGEPSVQYHVIRPGAGDKAQTVSVTTSFRIFDPAQESDAVLIACPDLRLMRGDTQVWEYQTPVCPERTGISDDGELAYGLLPDGGYWVLKVVGQDGSLLWERRFNRARENFLFAAGGKRFWFREYDGSEEKPFLRLVDAEGKTLKQWVFMSKEDNVRAVNNSGTLALVQLGDDLLALTDRGAVKLLIPETRFLTVMLHPSEPIVYTIDTVRRVGAVYRIDVSW